MVRERPRLRLPLRLLVLGGLLVPLANAEQTQGSTLERQFQAALAQYRSGNFAAAATQLENLSIHLPKSFEVHELLGLTYAQLSQSSKSIDQLQTAVQLKPDAAAARTNLATALAKAGKLEPAGEQFRKALELEPQNFDANHNLAEFYIQTGKIPDALPLLEAAHRIDPSSYGNSYDLALAYLLTNKLSDARTLVQSTLQQKDTGELHNLLGRVDEKDGKFVEAANEFETAAHMDPSEDNLFVWGSELLLHRTFEPAIDVFKHGTQQYANSPRLWIGLGMALYSRGNYEESIKALLAAADLDPADPRCYLFLSKAYLSSPNQAEDVIARFRRYAELEPANAMAQYYYALSLWKGKRSEETSINYPLVESLLEKSIALDGTLADAHLQLGIVYADQHQYAKSLPQYTRALELNPNLPDAHYRLGQYYVHSGEKDKAQQEFELYQKQQAQHMAEVDKERAEVQQFVYTAKAAPAQKP